MFESGAYVATHVTPVDGGDLTDDQPQPNGVDLTLDAVFEQRSAGRIGRDGTEIGQRRERPPEDGAVSLEPGGYVARYGERVHVPGGHVGFVYPRSSLMRNSCMLHTAVWDAGYEGRGEGLLEVHHPIEIEPGARIAQFVLAAADHEGTYNGSYQGEGL